jgi:hypothetical protein
LSAKRYSAQFAPWDTEVKDDDLTLVGVTFKTSSYVSYLNEGVSLRYGEDEEAPYGLLEVIFHSREKRAAVQFRSTASGASSDCWHMPGG